jgi:hypothetical protein
MTQSFIRFDGEWSPEPLHYAGVVFIGDPHIEARQPGFRKDNYPEAILRKLEWVFGYARTGRLLPIFLGDLFERPRDNPNRLINRMLDLFNEQLSFTIFGNHDCSEPQLTEDDSLAILLKGSRLRLLGEGPFASAPWIHVDLGGRQLVVGGASYRQRLPQDFADARGSADWVVWITHHDINDSSEQKPGLKVKEIRGIDAIVNGHIHQRREPIVRGHTQWWTPGNISRRSRAEAVTAHRPAILQLTFSEQAAFEYIEVPHQPAEEVFHPVEEDGPAPDQSSFVRSLIEFQTRKTQSGAGLNQLLQSYAEQVSPEVNKYLRDLIKEVTSDDVK